VLRAAVIVVSAVLLALGVFCFIVGRAGPGLISVVLAPAIVLVGVLFERRRYKALLDAPPGPDWQATAEKFTDPGTGEALVVYFQPSTGKRAYVRTGGPRGRA
jgi:hypothetical protein